MKIAIDLLPAEFRTEQLKNARFYKVQAIGVAAILTVIFLASLSVSLRLLQSQNIAQVQKEVTASEKKIADYKADEELLFLLKNRLNVINQYIGVSSDPTQLYNLVDKLLPSDVSINTISLDKEGEIFILARTNNGVSLDKLVSNLTSTSTNEGRISQVALDSVTRGRDGIYRISLKIRPSDRSKK